MVPIDIALVELRKENQNGEFEHNCQVWSGGCYGETETNFTMEEKHYQRCKGDVLNMFLFVHFFPVLYLIGSYAYAYSNCIQKSITAHRRIKMKNKMQMKY